MIRVENEFPFYRFECFGDCRDVLHFVSSGVKDIGFSEEKDAVVIAENRRVLALSVGFEAEQWVTAQQVHGVNVAVVTDAERGRGAMDRASRLPDTDALVTNVAGICLMVLSADCVPVLLYDPVCRAVGAVHAGWRGTAAGIVKKVVRVMEREYGCRPENLLAGIAPSIGGCCFEVGEDVALIFRKSCPEAVVCGGEVSGKCRVDLWEANRLALLEVGLKDEHIEVAGMCSVCHPDLFFSYRRDGKQAGRFGAGILLRERSDGGKDGMIR